MHVVLENPQGSRQISETVGRNAIVGLMLTPFKQLRSPDLARRPEELSRFDLLPGVDEQGLRTMPSSPAAGRV
jgi:hypothetical protein